MTVRLRIIGPGGRMIFPLEKPAPNSLQEARDASPDTQAAHHAESVKPNSGLAELGRFLRTWLSNPGMVGAVAPSGAALARAMTRDIIPGSGPILELGPGTGVFTRVLIARGVPAHDITLIEFGSDFARTLAAQFPDVRVLWMDAAMLAPSGIYVGTPVAAVVSGLPLLSMSPRKVLRILSGAFAYVRPGGAFYQFTYGPVCPVPRPVLDRLGLKARRIDRALLNIPPASVYRITRRPSRPGVIDLGQRSTPWEADG